MSIIIKYKELVKKKPKIEIKPLRNVTDREVNLGCDPEFFFTTKKGTIGAEKVLPKAGLSAFGQGKIIIDGVQAELNPAPDTCRDSLASHMVACFRQLESTLSTQKDISCDFSVTSEISKENLEELAKSSQKFGCAPSKSISTEKSKLDIKKVDGTKYRTRAAGGHIHLGVADYDDDVHRALKEDYKQTVALLDIVCGNTAVLIDRDKGNIERRKLYGRAGEYRLPKHGLEYRTLSNFWLMSKPLMSFALGMARYAVLLMADDDYKNYFNAFTSKVTQKKVHKAINNNDFDLAMENFLDIEPLIRESAIVDSGRVPINACNMKEFHHFVKMVNKHGLEHYFKQDPMTHWTKANKDFLGFNNFLENTVRTELKKVA